ncbi:hypothetical protein N7520_003858 [Penicillium odoratum]|uniref:uncharacterized protein n=1 Tax=Penicillium odoratum TaxID=1167516 RepID=UPI0025495C13|nr:uncharacterized protein N7520_003858 [Penicillium odoratum]KAJ5769299.1 hypothetical protein N7520_003858 [Penicillium odoratum]
MRPRYCIFRPNGVATPLFAMDELPSWLQMSNPAPEMYIGLQPVSPNYIPREGEYNVICNNCSSSVSSVNQSVSDRNEDIQSPQSSVSVTAEIPARIILEKFPIGLTIGHSALDATQSPVLGVYNNNGPTVMSQAVPVPVSPLPQPASIASSPASERLASQPSKSDENSRSDTPETAVDSSNNSRSGLYDTQACFASNRTSIASERSLTAAIERLRQRLHSKRASRQGSLRQKFHRAVQANSDWKKTPKLLKVHSKVRRRRRAKTKELKLEISDPIEEKKENDLKLEQSNSATKRRARRERLAQRILHGKNYADWHMTKMPK